MYMYPQVDIVSRFIVKCVSCWLVQELVRYWIEWERRRSTLETCTDDTCTTTSGVYIR